MASQWKYASLDADARLKRVEEGDKDVYDEEIARSKSVIRAREALGLDTSEQKDWIDALSYRYNLANAAAMGIGADKVSRTGYADRIVNGRPDSGPSKGELYRTTTGITSTPATDAKYRVAKAEKAAASAIGEAYDAEAERAKAAFLEKTAFPAEAIVNSGLSLSGGTAEAIRRGLRESLEQIEDAYNEKKQAALKKNAAVYAGLLEKLQKARESGTPTWELPDLASQLIQETAKQGGYDVSAVLPATVQKTVSALAKRETAAPAAAKDAPTEKTAPENGGAARANEMPAAKATAAEALFGTDGEKPADGAKAGADTEALRELAKLLRSLLLPDELRALLTRALDAAKRRSDT